MALDWNSETVEVLLNSRWAKRHDVEQKLHALTEFEGHIWLATSGTHRQKFVALSKDGFLTSAQIVNEHLHSTSRDIWLNPLPMFHVGGLSIWARAYLSGAGVIAYPDATKQRWDVTRFYQVLEQTQATLTSMVPAQVFDLVQNKLEAPKGLRALIVGGGYLSDVLFKQAIELGWPVAPTYGMTECCSQVAAAEPGSNRLKLLKHVEAAVDDTECLRLKSTSLFTSYAYEVDNRIVVEDPKLGGWYRTHDLAKIIENCVEVLGRNDDIIKVGGETVLLTALERKLSDMLHERGVWDGVQIIPSKDERLGMIVDVMVEKSLSKEDITGLITRFNAEVLPFERIRNVHWVDSIPRTVLGKMIKRVQ